MTILTLNEKEYELKTKLSELTLGEFQMVNNSFANINDVVDLWVTIISKLATIDKEEIYKVDSIKFQNLVVSMFDMSEKRDKASSVTIEGVVYNQRKTNSAKDMSNLETILAKEKEDKTAMIIASFFIEEGKEDAKVTIESIRAKSTLFLDLPCIGLIDYLYDSVNDFISFMQLSSPVSLEA